MSITTLVMGISANQCVNAKGWGLNPELRPESLPFPVGTVAAGAATAVHLSVHAAHRSATGGPDWGSRSTYSGEINTFSIRDECRGADATVYGTVIEPLVKRNEECYRKNQLLSA